MISFTDWFIPALIGTTFTLIGSLKLYGLSGESWVGRTSRLSPNFAGRDRPGKAAVCGWACRCFSWR